MHDKKLLIGGSAFFDSGVMETRLKQNSLFECAKSYVARRTATSGPGLYFNLVLPYFQ